MWYRTFFLSSGLWLVSLSLALGFQGWGPSRSSGTAVGGLSGGVLGAALGSQRGKTAEGALIGGVAGAILGNALGNQADIAQERRQAVYQQEYIQTVRSSVSFDQVIQMSQAGLSAEVIANQIQNQGIVARPTTQDIIYLKSQGVPDRVIASMQSAWTAGDRPVAPSYRPAPVYYERPVVVVEEYYRPVPYHHHHYRYRPAPPPYRGNHFGFTIGY